MQRGSQTKPVDAEMGDRLEDMICDIIQEYFHQAHASMYDTLEKDSNKSLYLGCKKSLKFLSMVLSLVNVKAIYGWSDKSFTSLLKVVQGMLLEENTLPKNYYEVKKILCLMEMEYQKIHVCLNNCILYRDKFEEMHKCPMCGVSQYKVKDDEEYSSDEAQRKVPPNEGVMISFYHSKV